MKKATAVLTAVVILMLTVMPMGAAASYTIREDGVDGEAVSFVTRYPRIYGLADARAQYRINRFFLDYSAYAAARAATLSALDNEPATGELIVAQTYNGRGLIGFSLRQEYHSNPAYSATVFCTMDLKTGNRLYFWELFTEGGAKREAVTRIFRNAALQRGEPGCEWVSGEIKRIGSMSFFLSDEGSLTVIFDKADMRALISVPLSELAPYLKPEYAPL